MVVELQPPEGVAGSSPWGPGREARGLLGVVVPRPYLAAVPPPVCCVETAMAPRPAAALRLLPGSCGWHPNQEPLQKARDTSEGKDLLGFSVGILSSALVLLALWFWGAFPCCACGASLGKGIGVGLGWRQSQRVGPGRGAIAPLSHG